MTTTAPSYTLEFKRQIDALEARERLRRLTERRMSNALRILADSDLDRFTTTRGLLMFVRKVADEGLGRGEPA